MKNWKNGVYFVVFVAGLTIIATAAERQIELRDGSILRGEVLSKNPDSLILQTVLGKQVIHRDQLSEKSLAELKLPSTDDPVFLRAKIAELEQRIAALEAENQQLRRQLALLSAIKPSETPAQPTVMQRQQSPAAVERGNGYWISSTGKRHNSNCRYYKTSKGREGGSSEGTACKICGG